MKQQDIADGSGSNGKQHVSFSAMDKNNKADGKYFR